jgi:long-chain acyl-CoA synthetase
VDRALNVIRAAAKPGAAVLPGANLELDLGLDSMERVELLAALEQACGGTVADEVAHTIYTVRELVEAVRPTGRGHPASAPATPWARLLADDPDDPTLASLLKAKPVFGVLAFLVMKTAYGFARVCLGLRVSGREALPGEGPYIVSPNHQSYLDAFLLVPTLRFRAFRQLFFVGASEYFATPLMKKLAQLINVVPVDPDANLVRAMQAGAFGLRHGKILVLFPEGERSPDGTVRTFKKGAAILAHHLNVPIVPVAIRGVFEIWPRGRGPKWRALVPWTRTRSALRFGEPIVVETGAAPADSGPETHLQERYARLTERLRTSVLRMWQHLAEGYDERTPVSGFEAD